MQSELLSLDHAANVNPYMTRIKGLFLLDDNDRRLIYGPEALAKIGQFVDFVGLPETRESIRRNVAVLERVQVIFSGWGGPVLDQTFLDAAPNLEAFFYGAGAMGSILTPQVWERGIVVTSALLANAVPVAEFTLSTILFSLKHGWRLMRQTKEQRRYPNRNSAIGCYGSTVGLISLGTIGRTILELLQPFELKVLAYDPYLSESEARQVHVERSTLAEIFSRCDVISIHTPLLDETAGMITGAHFESMRPGATFINTARGQLVREDEMIEVLKDRPDLQAVLDVTMHEPTEPQSQLYDLPNVVLTPHMAGSVGNECRRMGAFMAEELERFVTGKPLVGRVLPEEIKHSSHRPVAKAAMI